MHTCVHITHHLPLPTFGISQCWTVSAANYIIEAITCSDSYAITFLSINSSCTLVPTVIFMLLIAAIIIFLKNEPSLSALIWYGRGWYNYPILGALQCAMNSICPQKLTLYYMEFFCEFANHNIIIVVTFAHLISSCMPLNVRLWNFS